MEFTVQLEDVLAEELRRQASDEHTSVEELAQRLMRDALQERVAARRWCSQNRRRLDLIGKSRSASLSAEEARELEDLQAAVDQRLEPMDRQLLATAEQFRRLAEGLADEPTP